MTPTGRTWAVTDWDNATNSRMVYALRATVTLANSG